MTAEIHKIHSDNFNFKTPRAVYNFIKETILRIRTLLSSTCAEVVDLTLAPSWQGALNSHGFETALHPVKLLIQDE